jgi:hypothetical protein
MTVQTPQTLNQRLPSLLQSIHGNRLLACTSVQIFRPLAVRCNESTAHTIPALAHDHTPAETNISHPMRNPTAVRVTRTIGREIASRAGPPGQTRRVKAKTGERGSVRPERGGGSGWLPQLPGLLSPSLVLLLFRPRSLSLLALLHLLLLRLSIFAFPASDHHSCAHRAASVTTCFDTD